MRFSDEFLIEVKFRNDIEDIISRYTPLKAAGSNLVARCPFHSEKTPSFSVNKSGQFFYCFGCGAGGDVITFIMLIENTDYVTAVTKLAESANIPVPEDGGEYKAKVIRQKRVLELNLEAARYFHNNLVDPDNSESRNALEYILNRGVKQAAVKRFGLGYASNSFNRLTKYLSDKNFTKEEQRTAFLCGVTKNGDFMDYFRGRIIFPIIDVSGNVIAFGGRAMGDNIMPKYINTSDTPAFKKSRNLYALNFAKNSIGSGTGKKFDYFIMCEGYMDVIAMHQAGFTNAVATLGTAVTEEQARLMSKYAKRAVLAYDNDDAGKRATGKAAGFLGEAGIEVKVLSLGDAKDPDEFIARYGREKLENRLVKPKGYIDSRLDAIYEKYNLDNNNNFNNAEERIKALKESCAEIAGINSEVEREVYGVKLAGKYKMTAETVLKEIKRLSSARKRKEKADMLSGAIRKTEGYGDRINPDRAKYPESVKKEDIILGILFKYPEVYPGVKDILPEDLFVSGFNRKIYNLYRNALENNNNSFDIAMVIKDLTAEEAGRVTGTVFSVQVPGINIKSELENFIEALRKQNKVYEEKDVNLKEIAAMGDEVMQNFIEKQRREKLAGEKLKKFV
ncbi:MAG: DNA primase [Oscillospiraceae bacterium]|nr:DNA primase [Oscillospiraceae bacterium]